MPNTIFGTFDTASPSRPTFNSLNYLKPLSPSVGAKFGEGTFHVVKIFSESKLGDRMLRELFGENEVAKSWEKVWLAYPKLEPVRSSAQLAPVRPDAGFFYVNGFERLISTMETEVGCLCWSWAPSLTLHLADRLLVQRRLAPPQRPVRLHASHLLG